MTSTPFSPVDFPDSSQSPWTHPDTGLVYEYNDATGVWLPVSGGGGDFPDIDKPDQQPGTIDDRYVNRTGDTMTGGLESPALTTGPDSDDKSILFMDTGADSYNDGPHELEARSESATDWNAWILHPAAELNIWYAVAYGNGKYVAVSWDGNNRVMSSPDGETWTAHDVPKSQWESITYGNGKFVAVATKGTYRVMSSPDGETWTAHDVGEVNCYGVTFAQDSDNPALVDGKFVAVGGRDLLSSPDGETWTNAPQDEAIGLKSVTYGNGKFVAVKSSGSGRQVFTSPDGENWTSQSSVRSQWDHVTFAQDSNNPALVDGKFVAVSLSEEGKVVMTSPDGEKWYAHDATELSRWRSVIYGNGKFVAIASLGPVGGLIMTSPDGETWTAQDSPETGDWLSVTYGNGKFVVVGARLQNRVMTLDAVYGDGALYFDDELVYTSATVAPIREKVNFLANAVINNAESIEVIAPTVFRGVWEYASGTSPAAGNYTIDPDNGLFAGTTQVILDPVDSQGVDHTGDANLDNLTGFADVKNGNYFTILNTGNPYGLSGRITATEYDADGNFVVTLSEVRAVDDFDGDPSSVGPAVIKVQKLIDPSNIDSINGIIDGLNGNFNNIADQRGVVWVNDNESLPAYLPSGNSIPEGKLYFNSRYLQLYIRIGGSWLGLL